MGEGTVGARSSTWAADCLGGLLHAVSIPTISKICNPPRLGVVSFRLRTSKGNFIVWLILLEALGALLVLVFIVWWTMFSGRPKGERSAVTKDSDESP